MQNNDNKITQVIQHRRTIKPDSMNGSIIPVEQIEQIVAMADLAPTHGRTEPLRLNIYSGDGLKKFCEDHAALYFENTDEEKRNMGLHGKLIEFPTKVSHLIVAMMKRTEGSKISSMEEYASCCASVQNMLLTADSFGVSAMWNTGAMTYRPQMKTYLNLAEEDQVVALIYLGYTDEEHKNALRRIPLSEKNTWFN